MLGRLDHQGQGWGEVELHKQRIDVAAVSEGAESDLRHFLESIVLQVNADLAAPVESPQDADDHDGRMADAFRAFADRDP